MNKQPESANPDHGTIPGRTPLTAMTDVQVDAHPEGRSVDRTTSDVRPSARFDVSAVSNSSAPAPVSSTIAEFSRNLDRAMERCQSPDDIVTACAELLRRQAATFVGRYAPPGRRIGDTERLTGLTAPASGLDPDLQAKLIECSTMALAGCRQTITEYRARVWIHAVPFQSRPNEVLTTVSDATTVSRDVFSLLMSLAAARISEKYLMQHVEAAERGSRHVAALVELMAHLDQCRDVHEGCGRLARDLQRYLQADRMAVGYCDDIDTACTLMADTAQETINVHSDDTRVLLAVLEESIGRQAPSIWPTDDSDNRHALRAHQHLADHLGCRFVVACPLVSEEGRAIGAIAAMFGTLHRGECASNQDDTEVTDNAASNEGIVETASAELVQHAHSFLAASVNPIAATLSLLDRSSPGLWQHLRRAGRKACTQQRRRTAGVVVAAVTALLLVPMTYEIDCDAELQPVSRRFVASPFDGTLRECLVRPGEYVEKGTVLAVMDEREIQYELAGIQADMSGAQKERYSLMAEQKSGEAAIARHEFERLKHRSDLLTFRNKNLELRSPIDGIVVSGDHKDEEGVPLETGETLFEIAPLDSMIIEVAVPEEDIRWVREGMSIRLQLEAMPANVIHARIARIYPRAELKNHDNVFIVEAEIGNENGLLRPGMRGDAEIRSDRHTLGWNLFHKPAAWLAGWLGW
jgi:biotin carboxyl carrier protein